MSDDDEDPFESLEVPEDREGDPFERLGDVGPGEESDDAEANDVEDVAADAGAGTGDDTEGDVKADMGAGTVEDPEADAGEPADTDDEEPAAESPTDGIFGTSPASGASEAADDTEPTGESEPDFEEEFIDEGDPFPAGPGTTPSQSSGDGTTTDQTVGGDTDPIDEDDPFSGMDGREGDPFGEGESVFESVDVESVDTEEVWASLDEEPSTATVEGSRYVEVSKHRFCEQCEHFASPPDAHCTNEEAEIIEFLDMETVRLLNCPVVAEQRELEDEG